MYIPENGFGKARDPYMDMNQNIPENGSDITRDHNKMSLKIVKEYLGASFI